jgi:hypothetical protein
MRGGEDGGGTERKRTSELDYKNELVENVSGKRKSEMEKREGGNEIIEWNELFVQMENESVLNQISRKNTPQNDKVYYE